MPSDQSDCTTHYEHSTTHYGPSTTHYGPSTTHYDPSTTHYDPSTTHYDPSTTHYDPSTTHYDPSTTHYEPSTTHYDPSITHYEHSTTHYGPSTTHYDPSTTHYEPSTTHYDPSITHYEHSTTHYDPSITHYEHSTTHYDPSITHYEHSTTHYGPSTTHYDPSTTHYDPSTTHYDPSMYLMWVRLHSLHFFVGEIITNWSSCRRYRCTLIFLLNYELQLRATNQPTIVSVNHIQLKSGPLSSSLDRSSHTCAVTGCESERGVCVPLNIIFMTVKTDSCRVMKDVAFISFCKVRAEKERSYTVPIISFVKHINTLLSDPSTQRKKGTQLMHRLLSVTAGEAASSKQRAAKPTYNSSPVYELLYLPIRLKL
ncbi:Hypothetical predicted protein [Scomber scombrus]|uniref:Uncharacterized protein n=1 Tax=Scomber scombrus TaxID=13677 RepID=A0AAV1PWH0_SCOSC